MKKHLLVLLLGAWLFPATGQSDELRLNIAFDQPNLVETAAGTVLKIPGTRLLAHPGEPLLPQQTFYFVLPPGHRAKQLRISSPRIQTMTGAFDIAPAAWPEPLSGVRVPLPVLPKPSIYQSDQLFPGTWARLGSVQYLHGYALLPVTVTPLSYQPGARRVRQLRAATLVVQTEASGALRTTRATRRDSQAVRRRADQGTAVGKYVAFAPRALPLLEPATYDYLIIAPEAFVGLGGESSLEALRDFRQAQGKSAHIVTLEWILAQYPGTRPDGGQDDATRIRAFLTEAYAEWNLSYVLLVGDADADDVGEESGDLLLAMRAFYVNTYHPEISPDSLPSDMYYSCLDGSFDANQNGRYGERDDGPDGGEVDLLAELFVGRAPVDSETELRNFVAKTLAYEAGAGVWLAEVWMVGELLWSDPTNVYGAESLDQLVTGTDIGGNPILGFDSFPFFQIHSLYDRDQEAGTTWSSADLMPILDSGPHIVNHLGHSNVTYNMRLMNNHVDSLVNARPFLHYSQGCYNGSFDNRAAPEAGGFVYPQDCIAEHLVVGEHGAFAAIANSRYGWGSSFATGPSQRFHQQFWDAFFAEGVATIGQALADSKEDNAAAFTDPFVRWVGFENNLLGDPAVVLKKSINTSEPLIGIYPPQLDFISIHGSAAPEAKTLGLRNDGLGTLSYTASVDQTWVKLDPLSGEAPVDLTAIVDPTGLLPGRHEAIITFTSAEADNSPVTTKIEFLLVEVPDERVPHQAMAPVLDGVLADGEYAQALALAIDPNAAGKTMLYLTVSGAKLYLAIDDQLDPTDTGGDRVNLYFDKALDGQWPTTPADEGVYSFIAYDGGRTLFMPVFNGGAGAQIDYRGRERDPQGFAAALGFVDNHRVYELSLDLELSHLNIGPAGKFGLYCEVQNSEQMNPGTNTGTWPLDVPEKDDQLFFGRLDLLPQESWLDALPRSLSFLATIDQEPPAPETLQVVDLLDQTIPFSASSSASWLLTGPDSGQTPADLEISVNHAGLDLGSYQGEILFDAPTAGNSAHSVPVTLTVLADGPLLVVNPESFDLAVSPTDNNLRLQLTLHNQGNQEMVAEIRSTHAWLALDPANLSIAAASSQVVELTVAVSDLSLRNSEAEIHIEAPNAAGSPQTVPVRITVDMDNSAPPCPAQLAPADGSQRYSPVELTATTVLDPEGDEVSYRFEFFDTAGKNLDSGLGQISGNSALWQPTIALAPGTYRWQVTAIDALAAESDPSPSWSFAVIAPPVDTDTGCSCAHETQPSRLWLMLIAMAWLVTFRRRR